MHESEAELRPFSEGTELDVARLRVLIRREEGTGIYLRYSLEGEISRLRIPAPVPSSPADGLWKHTCFEAFFAREGDTAYREFNFSPSGQWAAYEFSAYRDRNLAWSAPLPPRIEVLRDSNLLTLEVRLDSACLPALPPACHWRIGLSAVIEGGTGTLGYWALTHPSVSADFHARDGFSLRWPPK